MAELYTNTIKYYRLAIKKFLPTLIKRRDEAKDTETQKKLNDLIEMYTEVAAKIDQYNLNLEDPNRFYDGEPDDIDINLSEKNIEHFSRLTLRLLETWKQEMREIENKDYLTDQAKEKFYELKELVWPLEAQFNNQSRVLFKNKGRGTLEFPGEEIKSEEVTEAESRLVGVFPEELITKLPRDIQILCREFNSNYEDREANSCILLLRRILPLSIVRKFQKIDEENEIVKNGEHLDTKGLIGKAEKIIKTKRAYKEIMNFKILLDSSQHSYTLNATIIDAQGAGLAVRIFLDDLFGQEKEE